MAGRTLYVVVVMVDSTDWADLVVVVVGSTDWVVGN
jgi:hypothetical protein